MSYFTSLPGDVNRYLAENFLSLEDIEALRRTNRITRQQYLPFRQRIFTPLRVPEDVIREYLLNIPIKYVDFVTETLYEITPEDEMVKITKTTYPISVMEDPSLPWRYTYILRVLPETYTISRSQYEYENEEPSKVITFDLFTQYRIYRRVAPHSARNRTLIELNRRYGNLESASLPSLIPVYRKLSLDAYMFGISEKPHELIVADLHNPNVAVQFRVDFNLLYQRLKERILTSL